MSGAAPPDFADQFWEHINLPLSRFVTALARCVAADVETFGGAMASLSRFAWKRGAGYLPDDRQAALRSWLVSSLDQEITQADADGWSSWLADNHIIGGRVP